VQQMKRELTSVIKNLNALTQKVEKMINKIESAEKSQAKPKKMAVPKKAGKKTAESSKGVATKKAAKKPAVKKASKKAPETMAPGEMTGKVLSLIKSAPEGMDTAQIMDQTGLNKKQVWGIVSSAKKAGKLKTGKRGIYIAS